MKIRAKTVLLAAALTGLLAGCGTTSGKKTESKAGVSADLKADKGSCGAKSSCTSKATCRSKGNCDTKGS
jgi:hypothetical protein